MDKSPLPVAATKIARALSTVGLKKKKPCRKPDFAIRGVVD
jgi:hypothetical protein